MNFEDQPEQIRIIHDTIFSLSFFTIATSTWKKNSKRLKKMENYTQFNWAEAIYESLTEWWKKIMHTLQLMNIADETLLTTR